MPCTPTHIGGQAVMEGVMMRGKHTWAIAARDPQGVIHSEEHPLKSAAAHNAWMRWPIIRGVVSMVESLVLGTKALTISAKLAGLEELEEEGESVQTDTTPAPEKESALSDAAIAGSLVIGAVGAVGIFIFLPAIATNLIVGSAERNLALWNTVDGIARLVAFFLYVWLIGRIPDIKRVFQYHGAEHKTIHAVEHGDDLTPEAAAKYPTLHVRCGTAFLIMVMALSILVFSLIPIKAMVADWGITNTYAKLALVIASRLLLLPFVAGLAYEVTVKWAGPRANHPLVKIILWPGLQMQRLTTAEPDAAMLEVAIVSTKLVQASDAAAERAHLPLADPVLTGEFDLLDDAI